MSSTQSDRTFVLASRASKLAQIQTNATLASFRKSFPSHKFEASFVTSEAGDKDKTQPLYVLGGKSLWTKELEVALKEDAADMLVHCLKDMPTVLPEGCKIAAILERASPIDSLVVKKGKEWKSLDEIPDGSTIGTGSIRRVAQLKRSYPRLQFKDVRGNLDTRMAKLDDPEGPYAAIVLAKAGLVRFGLENRITCDLVAPVLRYAVGQGALAIEIRSDDTAALELCRALAHWQTEWACSAERACLRVLEGGCSVPVGVNSEIEVLPGDSNKGILSLTGSVTSIGGDKHVEFSVKETVESLQDAEAVGVKVAHKLMENGAKDILDEVNVDRAKRIGEEKSASEVQKVESMMEVNA